jgi:hypothetical protein
MNTGTDIRSTTICSSASTQSGCLIGVSARTGIDVTTETIKTITAAIPRIPGPPHPGYRSGFFKGAMSGEIMKFLESRRGLPLARIDP